MSKEVDAWQDEWTEVADKHPTSPPPTGESNVAGEPKKVSSKVTKAQRRAQQAEFNRQLWAEACVPTPWDQSSHARIILILFLTSFCLSSEGPQETNYFLESRNVVPLRSEFKPPPILLSRKGPIIQKPPKPPTSGLQALDLNGNNKTAAEESSEDDEDEVKSREQTLAERQAQAAREREEKQRRYDERRQELFGPNTGQQGSSTKNNNSIHSSQQQHQRYQHSGTSTPSSLTPPGSRSATPNRARMRGGGGGGGGGRRGGGTAAGGHAMSSRTRSRGSPSSQSSQQQQQQQSQSQPTRDRERERELYDPSYAPRPDSNWGVIYDQQHQQQQQPQQRYENAFDGMMTGSNPGIISSSNSTFSSSSRLSNLIQSPDLYASQAPPQQRQQPQQPIREPRGPDGSGRGGFGFSSASQQSSRLGPRVVQRTL
ncbi:hypothetical protein HRR94_007321 [Exophiala dermatitidis]|nr:hypothetical protein HRR78_007289 [Exophiala dermatitidis]KAJ4574220.1 hypothetical protein HRR82_006496 [Exophiala dermatitidis]KAJ4692657.1 hypothetical protein HRR87_006430 [Exophiala dermatitidis]KAJ8997607.1 hypothetical protein HRR94_007321 [Exophiala dermatitidis]